MPWAILPYLYLNTLFHAYCSKSTIKWKIISSFFSSRSFVIISTTNTMVLLWFVPPLFFSFIFFLSMSPHSQYRPGKGPVWAEVYMGWTYSASSFYTVSVRTQPVVSIGRPPPLFLGNFLLRKNSHGLLSERSLSEKITYYMVSTV